MTATELLKCWKLAVAAKKFTLALTLAKKYDEVIRDR